MRVGDPAALRRIKALMIPPAWTEVWICPRPNGHIQATGRDAKGRKQYRYHPRWRAVRDTTKYDRLVVFGRTLPQLRARLAQDMARPGLPRQKVLATVVQLLETTLIRIAVHAAGTGRPRMARVPGAAVVAPGGHPWASRTITGSSWGLGLALAREFARAGCRL